MGSRAFVHEFYVRRILQGGGTGEPLYMQGLFPQQRAFLADTSKKKAALCTRRAGKTEALAAWFLDGARDCPGGLSVYIARSRADARMILWNTLLRVNARHKLGLEFKTLDQQLIVETRNEHRIWLAGCADVSEIGKFRGIGGTQKAGIRRAAIDEAQTFPPWLADLVNDSLEPTLLDQDGDLAIVGTPGAVPAGPFYVWTTGDGGAKWPTHTWSVLDNPHLPHAGAWLEAKRIENKWTDEHPTYQREWRGRWVLDRNALVYPYESERNAIQKYATSERPADRFWLEWQACPEHDRVYVLAIDIGSSEVDKTTAFALIGFRRGFPEILVLKSWKVATPTSTRIVAEILKVKSEHRLAHIVADAGALAGGMIREMNERYSLNVEAAEKQHKRAFIEIVAGELLSGVVKVDPYECRELLDEWLLLPWDEDRKLPDDRFLDHCADATLYGIRAVRTYYRPKEDDPPPGTPAAINAESDKHKAELEKLIRKRQREQARKGWRK